MIEPALSKCKPRRTKSKKSKKSESNNNAGGRQDTCTPEQYWIGKYFYGYED